MRVAAAGIGDLLRHEIGDVREVLVSGGGAHNHTLMAHLRRFFGLSPARPSRKTKWLILDAGGRLVGVIVDSVLDVFSSAEHRQRHVPVLDERHRERGITSAYRHDAQLVFLLDAARLAEPAMQIPSDEISHLPSEAP